MGTFAPQCGARRGGLLNRLTTERWGAVSAVGGEASESQHRAAGGETLSVSLHPGPQSEIYLSYRLTGRRTQARKYLQPTSTVYTRRRRSGWVAECGAGA
eukprot:148822-Rhodomonas_salina.1